MESFAIAPDFTAVASGAEGDLGSVGEEGTTAYEDAIEEYASLEEIREQIAARLEQDGLEMYVQFRIDERGLVVGLIGPQVFFGADDASLTDLATLLIDDLSGPLRDQPRSLSIEGHANSLPSSNYATNWELSSARSTQVLRRMVESGGIDPASIGATGYGDARPAADGTGADALAANRRVDVVVVPDVSDEVRALLPEIAEAVQNGSITLDDLRASAARSAQNEGDPT
ncbi:OmpA/MotB family protein [Demequina litorisediminis]|uniref:OmpA-like domain-containing protein n=1 Tax=Demequina litorisediminis TaxID=1849022 RepID=A0ABQ6ICT7_9MICO|nr:hypothetical protein GCM10025876_18520 [Demequina litorisediminis]